MSDPTPEEAPKLEYAPPPGAAWIGRHRKSLIFLALILAIAGPTWWYRESLKTRVLWLYWSHRAAVHVMPTTNPVSVVGPEANNLVAGNPDYLPSSPFKPLDSTQPAASYNPVAFRELIKLEGRLRSMYIPDGPIIFLGTLHRPDGDPRLVIITGGTEHDSRYMMDSVGAAVLPPPGWFDPIPSAGASYLRLRGGSGPPPQPATYYTGTIDPRDASHVIISYAVSESIDAMLRRAATTRVSLPGRPAPRPSPADIRGHTPQVIGQGEIDVYLKDDDSLHLAIRGPGQLANTIINADPATLQKMAQSTQTLRAAVKQNAATSPSARRGRNPRPQSTAE